MKKLIVAIAFITGLNTLANAQQAQTPKTPAQKAAHKTAHLQKKLALTTSQTKQVNAIYLTEATRLDTLKANTPKGNKQARKEKHKAIEAQSDQKLNAVLTVNQKKVYAAFKEAKKEKQDQKKAAAAAVPKQ
ncbi:hypothetical protein [Mucilaginibacter sp. SP1R1]|uniref:hypothetical protein n=1 Tax=Mucilaginibacter sp. SP1R1 TaxID=2723091 RepID=UPI00160EEA52|nr:hypothetical protein [Mucilaginibacter sp. SP1R1]MBB6152778.1 hypothetical protein [Mucilaginibacter sp. SP1R1]